ncbi:MAG: cobalt ECF transporter T component CbiQ [Dorea sp.]|jgi:cobalt/nickel transport system permease protein|nr:cobalt ECF transporter T component CbiQ [Dorea sp.]
MIPIDKLSYYSNLRHVNAAEKFTFSMLSLTACIVSRSIVIALLILSVTGILNVCKGGLPLSVYIRLMRIPVVFLVSGTLAIYINISKTPLDAFAFPVGAYYITGSIRGLLKGTQLICTALSSVSCLYFLSLNTPMTDILNVLKRLHVPALILELMLLIYRYIFVIMHLASDITVSQNSRLGNIRLSTAGKSFAAMVSSVFIKSIRRSREIYDALEARCYDGTLQVLSEDYPIKLSEILCIAVFETLLYLMIIIGRLSGGIL